MSIKKIIGGICGIVLGINCMGSVAAKAEDTNEIIQRDGWEIEQKSNNSYSYGCRYSCYSHIYSNNKVEIVCQCVNASSNGYDFELTFDDYLYDVSIETDYDGYWDIMNSYNNNDIVYIFKRKKDNVQTGKLLTITLTPKMEFERQTSIDAFGHKILVNEGNGTAETGDFNYDGVINAEDAALILQYSAEFGSGITTTRFDYWCKEKLSNSES